MIVDSHCHLHDPAFADVRGTVIRATEHNVWGAVAVGFFAQAVDGALGAYILEEMAAKGIHGFPVGAFDNGMRQITPVSKPIVVPADLKGMRMRVPAGAMFDDMFRTLGCEPVTINSIDIYAGLKSGKADAQENPLALVDGFKLYEVVKYVSMTNHMWSGFNLLANQAAWNRIPLDIRAVIERQATKAVRLQRLDQEKANTAARGTMAGHGLAFNVGISPARGVD